MMNRIFAIALVTAVCQAQVTIPEGTKLRVRLENSISSATAQEGQVVELSVSDPVKVGDVTVVAEGARVTGNRDRSTRKAADGPRR
jgi:hypothetical protein